MQHLQSSKKKISLAVLFGGRSTEHEISIITALQAIQAIDPEKYTIVPVYISPAGSWYTGKGLLNRAIYKNFSDQIPDVYEVTLLPKPNINALIVIDSQVHMTAESQRIPIDCCFLAFHGQQGEDGCVQGLLELADIPYTGCDVTTSALTMHKHFCKAVVRAHGVPTLPGICVSKAEVIDNLDAVCQKIRETEGLEKFPLFVKPCRLGSSIGIAPAFDIETLHGALAKAFQYDDLALVEPLIMKPLEVNISVRDGKNGIQTSVVEIPLSACALGTLTYDDKYLNGGSKDSQGQQQGMASLSRIIDPKDLPEQVKKAVTKYAIDAYKALGCSGVSRLDFIIDTTNKEQVYFNELNPMPGSFAFYLWAHGDNSVLYTHMIDDMVVQAQKRKASKMSLQSHIGFKAL